MLKIAIIKTVSAFAHREDLFDEKVNETLKDGWTLCDILIDATRLYAVFKKEDTNTENQIKIKH